MQALTFERNRQVASFLYEIAELLDLQGETFKPRAYRKAAKTIESLSEDIANIAKRGELEEIPGVGSHIAPKIDEIVKTGGLTYLDRLKKDLPPGVRELSGIEGIGPKRALLLSKELGVTSVAKLEEAARAGLVRDLPGFGEKSEQNILRIISAQSTTAGRVLLGDILPVAEEIVQKLMQEPSAGRVSLAGSIRRMKETIGDVDILASSAQSGKLMNAFVSLPGIERVVGKGPTKSTIVLKTGVQVDLRVVREDQFWTALQYFTGSKDHNIALRQRALDRGWTLNEYGITEVETGKNLPGKEERELYTLLDLQYIEPELRENRGEVDAAENGNLPSIVSYNALRGDLHVHSSWSDGSDTIREMADAARVAGYEYLAICDHTQSPETPQGITEDRIAEQQKEIESINREIDNITVLSGIECSIKSDGTLDIGKRFLKDFDLVVAGIHSGLQMREKELTNRISSALHNDAVSILAHPTGRILKEREPAALDYNILFATAKDLGVLLEINGHPSRLDLPDTLCIQARETGVKFVVSSDAHARIKLRNVTFGIATARRGWLEAKDIANTLPKKELLQLIQK